MNVELPNGTIIEGVPEGTPQSQIQKMAIAGGLAKLEDFPQVTTFAETSIEADKQQLLKDLASEQSLPQAAAIAIGKGMYDIGRGLGIIDPPTETESQGYKALEAERPITTTVGQAVGQSAPFLVPSAGVGAIASTPARIAAATGLGAAEGGLIAEGTGGNFEDVATSTGLGGAIAGGAEMAFPHLGRIARKLYASVKGQAPDGSLLTPGGTPTPELQEALDQAGMTWEGLKVQAQDVVANQPAGANPEEVARLARFENIGAPALAGEVSQDLGQRKLEQGLLESTSESVADTVRSTKLAQSEAIKSELDNVVSTLGVSPEAGETIKSALNTRKEVLKADRKAAYNALARESKNFGDIPISGSPILEAMPDKGTLRDIAAIAPNQYKAINDLLVEYGIEQSEDAVASALSRGVEVTPLSLENFESMRKRLNAIGSSDQSGAINVIAGPLKKALDDEIDFAVKNIEGSPNADVAQLAKTARQSNIALKDEFDEAKITSKLIDSVKRGSSQPKIEASKAYQKIMSPNAPIEDLDRVLLSLGETPQGKAAIKDMQGRAVLDLLDSAFSAQSRQISGQRVFGATPYSKQFEKLEPKLDKLFADNPADLERLKQVYSISQDIIPPSGAVPKGSAGYFIDALNKAGVYSVATKVPFARELFEIAQGAGVSAAKRRQAEAAIDAKPGVRELAKMIDRDYPQIAATLGIAGIANTSEEDKP